MSRSVVIVDAVGIGIGPSDFSGVCRRRLFVVQVSYAVRIRRVVTLFFCAILVLKSPGWRIIKKAAN